MSLKVMTEKKQQDFNQKLKSNSRHFFAGACAPLHNCVSQHGIGQALSFRSWRSLSHL